MPDPRSPGTLDSGQDYGHHEGMRAIQSTAWDIMAFALLILTVFISISIIHPDYSRNPLRSIFSEVPWMIASWVITKLFFSLIAIQMREAGGGARELLRRLHPDRNVPETVLILMVLLACCAIGISGKITLFAISGTFLLIVFLKARAI